MINPITWIIVVIGFAPATILRWKVLNRPIESRLYSVLICIAIGILIITVLTLLNGDNTNSMIGPIGAFTTIFSYFIIRYGSKKSSKKSTEKTENLSE